MPEIVERTKRPVTVRTRLWTGLNVEEMREFCGLFPGGSVPLFAEPDPADGVYASARVWNDQEHCWINVPVGHHLVAGPLGEFYPISPAALEETYEPLDPADVPLAESEREGARTRPLNTPVHGAESEAEDD